MGSLTGTVVDVLGNVMPTARVTLDGTAATSSGEVRLGPIRITPNVTTGAFTLASLPDGSYRISVRYYDPAIRKRITWTSALFAVSGATDLGTALGAALLTGPAVTVIELDTDSEPYFDPDGGSSRSVFIDVDDQPYYDTGVGGENVYSDVDGAPVVLTL